MRKQMLGALVVAAASLMVWAPNANAITQTLSLQDFSTGTSGWFDSSNGWVGTITWNPVEQNATVFGSTVVGDNNVGPYTDFGTVGGSSNTTWPGDWMAELDVYLDPTWAEGTGFDYSVASNHSGGGFLRDFIFHVAVDGTGLWVGASNNSNYAPLNRTAGAAGISQAGWYTLQQVFTDNAGVLAVDMNVLDSQGNVVFTTTLSDPADTIGDTGTVGGPRYGWFVYSTIPGGVQIDNTRLSLVFPTASTKDDCKNAGFTTYGFDNQGRCVASVQANAHAGK